MKQDHNTQHNLSDEVRCPQCGYRFPAARQCPRCGYSGYIPMSEQQTKRIRWILFPVLQVIAVIVLVIRRYAG